MSGAALTPGGSGSRDGVLALRKTRAKIEVTDILFDEDGLDECAEVERLTAAFASARV